MPIFPQTIAVLVVAGVAGAASLAASQGSDAAAPLVCELRLDQSSHGLTLQAQAMAPTATSGTYTLEVAQSGPGGRTQIRQAGDFDLPPGTRVTLGEARLSGSARDLSAELTLTANGQRQSCTDFSL